ncbi:EmrB/QacA subfamily drug resistance transporter [Nocardia transvalensis]|uniref:EmrB/QacA subfamily drug resistance transporter n=1 Tax=Nocardia transvalensis TaxID=37333 RepID=A0A7W9PM03_9NOCA|nr:MFS transporter [Nocardia transvalensis]MBB5918635.1 EmrB/QacA subfamily drug resistance transporter [Nocardia transvalensis]
MTTTATPQSFSPSDVSSPHRWRVLAVAGIAQFLAILDLFALTVAFPTLRESFGDASPGAVSWVLNAYTIVMAALLVPAGRLADDTSRKRGFLTGIALFGLASVACGLAPNLWVLIAARVVQAAAAALLVPTGLGLVLPVFDKREHATVMGIWTAIAAAGGGSGPVIGGLLLQASWRWIFFLNIPFTLVAFVLGLRVLPEIRQRAGRRLDLLGAALILGATAALTTVFVQAADWGYGSPATIGSLVAAIALGALFARHARRHPDPVVSPVVLRHRMFRVATLGVFCYYLGFAALILEGTLFLTQHWHYSELRASLGIAPIPLSCLLASPLSGRIVARIGGSASAALGGAAIALGAVWWAALAGVSESYPLVFLPGAILAGISTTLLQPPLFGASALLPADQLSLGSGTLMMARQTSSALGVAVLTAVLGRVAGLGEFRAGWIYTAVTGTLAAVAGLAFRERASGSRPDGDRTGQPSFSPGQP